MPYLEKPTRGRMSRNKLDAREIVFLSNYYAADSPTKGNASQSALAAGYGRTFGTDKALVILRKYDDCSFRASAKAVGITKPYLAMKLKQILDLPVETCPKEVLAAMRLTLSNFGESTDSAGNSGGVTITGPTMVIVGATQSRMKALRQAPQRQVMSGRVMDAQAEVSNSDGPDARGNIEAESQAGGRDSGAQPRNLEMPAALESTG